MDISCAQDRSPSRNSLMQICPTHSSPVQRSLSPRKRHCQEDIIKQTLISVGERQCYLERNGQTNHKRRSTPYDPHAQLKRLLDVPRKVEQSAQVHDDAGYPLATSDRIRTYRGGRGCSAPGVGIRYVDSRNERVFAVAGGESGADSSIILLSSW